MTDSFETALVGAQDQYGELRAKYAPAMGMPASMTYQEDYGDVTPSPYHRAATTGSPQFSRIASRLAGQPQSNFDPAVLRRLGWVSPDEFASHIAALLDTGNRLAQNCRRAQQTIMALREEIAMLRGG